MKVTEILAIYAACLSTVVFIWNVARAIPRVNVKIVLGLGKTDEEHVSGVYVVVQNPSPHTVHIAGINILYPYGTAGVKGRIFHFFQFKRFPWHVGWVHTSLSNYGLEDGCPLSLEAGKSHMVFVPQKTLDKILKDGEQRVIKAMVQDQLWRNKYSRKFEVPKFV